MNNGSTEIICYQSEPEWIYAIEAASYGITVEEVEEILYTEAGQTEACLVLDAYVPAGVFDGNSTSKGQSESPGRAFDSVLLFLYKYGELTGRLYI